MKLPPTREELLETAQERLETLTDQIINSVATVFCGREPTSEQRQDVAALRRQLVEAIDKHLAYKATLSALGEVSERLRKANE